MVSWAFLGMVVVLVVIAALAVILTASKKTPAPTFPYQKDSHLFSPRSDLSWACQSRPSGTSTASWERCGWPMSSGFSIFHFSAKRSYAVAEVRQALAVDESKSA
jgi:hypothetical protein